jgi:hypothetical protein
MAPLLLRALLVFCPKYVSNFKLIFSSRLLNANFSKFKNFGLLHLKGRIFYI